MKYSIGKKMFFVFMTTITLSFIMIFICFNFITSKHIDQEALTALNNAVTTAKELDKNSNLPLTPSSEPNVNTSEDKALSTDPFVSEGSSISNFNINTLMANNIYNRLIESNQTKEIGFFLTNPVNDSILYPIETVYSVKDKENKKQSMKFYDTTVIEEIRNYISKNEVDTPRQVKLNNVHYYIVQVKLNDQMNVTFYKNIQSLKELASNVNVALLVLLLLFGILSVTVSMKMTKGIVHSIQKLGNFAHAIGSGNLKQQDLHLKEKELAVLERDMNQMAKKLSEYDTEQKIFFQNVSHELKTPLMSIQGYAEGITSHIFKEKKAEEAAEIILTESDRLATMVDNLLFLSYLDSKNRFEIKETFDCGEELRRLVDQSKSLVGEKEILYNQVGDEFLLNGNQEAFDKAILNIVTNCIRYANSRITVTCLCKERLIRIADDGPGIDDKDMPHIFKRFYKGEDGCSGIGLAIADAAISSMNGSIKVENNQGALFIISFQA